MFDQVFENLRKATDSTIHMQQEMLAKWLTMWPVMPSNGAAWSEPVQKFQKRWAEIVSEMARKQQETLQSQFNTGLQHIEEAFRLGEVKDPEELRVKSIELWKKTFDCLRQVSEVQMRDFQTAMTKCTELVMKGAT